MLLLISELTKLFDYYMYLLTFGGNSIITVTEQLQTYMYILSEQFYNLITDLNI